MCFLCMLYVGQCCGASGGGVVDVLKALAAVWVGVWNPSLCGAANILAVPSSSLALVLFIPMLYNDSLSLISQQRFTVLWENWSISFAKIEISLLSRLILGCDRWLIIVLYCMSASAVQTHQCWEQPAPPGWGRWVSCSEPDSWRTAPVAPSALPDRRLGCGSDSEREYAKAQRCSDPTAHCSLAGRSGTSRRIKN